jgi:hypothetical protein
LAYSDTVGAWYVTEREGGAKLLPVRESFRAVPLLLKNWLTLRLKCPVIGAPKIYVWNRKTRKTQQIHGLSLSCLPHPRQQSPQGQEEGPPDQSRPEEEEEEGLG